MKPQRIQLRRSKGWRMPPNTIKVDRTTPWGNPFIVGPSGTQLQCVFEFELLVSGYICLSETHACVLRQEATKKLLQAEKDAGWPTLRGKNLACWCRPGTPCHADVLLNIANRRIKKARSEFAKHVELVKEYRERRR